MLLRHCWQYLCDGERKSCKINVRCVTFGWLIIYMFNGYMSIWLGFVKKMIEYTVCKIANTLHWHSYALFFSFSNTFVIEWFAGINCIIYCCNNICDSKMIQFMPANHSNSYIVITILIHSALACFQNVFITLLRRIAKDVTSSLLSGINAMIFKCRKLSMS